jgi:hypothetical protein
MFMSIKEDMVMPPIIIITAGTAMLSLTYSIGISESPVQALDIEQRVF